MKVIDLLNKIANGEIEANTELFYKKEKYRHIDNLFENYYVEEVLNDEVEIIEEDKKIEKLEIVHNGSANAYALLNEYGTKCALTKHSKVMCDKINEIIDKLNEMEKE